MKKLVALTIAFVMLFALTACASNTGSTNTGAPAPGESSNALPYAGVKIGYCPVTLNNSLLKWIADTLTFYCAELGIEVIATEGEANIATQITQMENFIAMGCDIIIAHPTNLDAAETVVNQARAQGIKVLFWANDPPYEVEAVHIDNAGYMGTMCGEMALKWADDTFGKDVPAGSIKVCWLRTEYDDRPAAKTRQDAMVDTVLADPRFQVVFTKDGIRNAQIANEAMNECLAQYPDINVIFAYDGGYAIGANSAIMADKSLDYSKIAIFSVSNEDPMMKLVDQSATNDDSVLRGLVTFGGNTYITNAVKILTGLLDGTVPVNSVYFADLISYNTIGYVSSYDPATDMATYVKNSR